MQLQGLVPDLLPPRHGIHRPRQLCVHARLSPRAVLTRCPPALILTKVWKLWGKNSAVVFISSVMFVITQLGAVVFVAASIADVWRACVSLPQHRACISPAARRRVAIIHPRAPHVHAEHQTAPAEIRMGPDGACAPRASPPRAHPALRQIVFDVFLFLMVCANALSRPRESHTLLMKVLYRDGIGVFIVSPPPRPLRAAAR